MKQERKTAVIRAVALILTGIACLLWAALCVRDGIGGSEGFLRFASAVLWCLAFGVQLRRAWKGSSKDRDP